jgi:hypothetical protein
MPGAWPGSRRTTRWPGWQRDARRSLQPADLSVLLSHLLAEQVEEGFTLDQAAALAADLGAQLADLLLGGGQLGALGAGPARGQVLGTDPADPDQVVQVQQGRPGGAGTGWQLVLLLGVLDRILAAACHAAASLRVTQALPSVNIGYCLSAAARVAACGMDWFGAPGQRQSPAKPAGDCLWAGTP